MSESATLRRGWFALAHADVERITADLGESSGSGIAVWVALARLANQNRSMRITITVNGIAHAARQSAGSVHRRLHDLAELGLLEILPNHSPGCGDRTANTYVLKPTCTPEAPVIKTEPTTTKREPPIRENDFADRAQYKKERIQEGGKTQAQQITLEKQLRIAEEKVKEFRNRTETRPDDEEAFAQLEEWRTRKSKLQEEIARG